MKVVERAGSTAFSTYYPAFGVVYGSSGLETPMYNEKPYDFFLINTTTNAKFQDPRIGKGNHRRQ